MSPAVFTDASWNGLKLIAEPVRANSGQRARILAALARSDGPSAQVQVDEENLSRYFAHLSRTMSLPFSARYPQPMTPAESAEFACTVVELLDPQECASDEFSGIYCKTRKGDFEVNLPLGELDVPEDDPNSQLIDDYCYWFWHCR